MRRKDSYNLVLLAWLLLIMLVLLSGEARGDPTTKTHSILQHDELYEPTYCLISYLWMWQEIKLSPGVNDMDKKDIQSRGKGIQADTFELLKSAGHSVEEYNELAAVMEDHMITLSTPNWLLIADEIGCASRTDKYSAHNLSL